MSKNNIRLLTSDELLSFTNKYIFENKENLLFVKTINFNRPTIHYKTNSFSIVCKGRKITITPEAIELWENNFPEKNLIEIQNAINKLLLMYQKP